MHQRINRYGNFLLFTSICSLFISCGRYCENLKRKVNSPGSAINKTKYYVKERDQGVKITNDQVGKLTQSLDARSKSTAKQLTETLNQKTIRIRDVFEQCKTLLRADRCSEENWALYRETIRRVTDETLKVDELNKVLTELTIGKDLGGIEQQKFRDAVEKYLTTSPRF